MGFFVRLFSKKRARLELRFLTWAEADALIRETNGGWTIAPEEDRNPRLGMVYLELLEPR